MKTKEQRIEELIDDIETLEKYILDMVYNRNTYNYTHRKDRVKNALNQLEKKIMLKEKLVEKIRR